MPIITEVNRIKLNFIKISQPLRKLFFLRVEIFLYPFNIYLLYLFLISISMLKIKYIVNLFLLFYFYQSSAQSSVFQFQGKENNSINSVLSIDNNSQIIGGSFEDSASINGYALKSLDTSAITSSKKTSDIFISKINLDGNIIWAKIFGGYDKTFLHSLSKDKTGNILFLADFTNKIVIGEDTLKGIKKRDCALIKLNSNGEKIWSKIISSSVDVSPSYIITDDSNNIYITGNCNDTFYVDGKAYYRAFMSSLLIKFDAQGNVKWSKIFSANTTIIFEGAFIKSIAVLPTGELILTSVTGKYKSFIDDLQIVEDDTTYRTCIIKIKEDNTIIWKNIAKGPCTIKNIELDDKGDFYLGGLIHNPLLINNKTIVPFDIFPLNDVFLAKFNSGGNLNWIKIFGKKNRTDFFYKLKKAPNNKLFLSADFETGYILDDTTLITKGMQDSYIAEFDTSSALIKIITSNGENNLCQTAFTSIDIDNNSNLFIAGTFNVITNVNDTKLVTTDKTDGFLWKLSNWATPSSLNDFKALNFGFTIFPNPSLGDINIEFYISKPEKISFELTDLTGKTIRLKGPISYTSGKYNEQFDLKDLMPGCYFVKAITATKIETRKLIITGK